MLDSAYIFRTSDYAPGIYDTLFGGIFAALGAPMMAQVALLITFPIALGLAYAESMTGRVAYRRGCQAFALLSFLLIAFFLVQPWDELFVNLRHSLHWSEVNRFSFNRYTSEEGTADFLTYFMLGCLAKFGVPLVEMSLVQSFLGGLLCAWAGKKLLEAWEVREAGTWGLLGMLTFAPLCLNSAQGFATTTFAAAILGSLYLLLFSDRRKTGWLLLSLVPLVRFEGIYWLALAATWVIVEAWRKGKLREALLGAALSLLPTVGLSAFRYHEFGQIVPLPVQYKASLGSLFFFIVGMRNFFTDLVTGGGVTALLTLGLCDLALRREGEKNTELRRELVRLWIPVLLLGAFVFPYYLSGGDWMPRYWGRYFLPFSLGACLAAAACLRRALPALSPSRRPAIVALISLTLLLQLPWYFSSYRKMVEDIFVDKKIMANIFSRRTGIRHARIHHLSQLGLHLGRTSGEREVIASSEVATIMYFAHREALDLLGVANPELVHAPLRKPPSLLRRFPEGSELPYLIFRRVDPTLVARHHPEYVFTFDYLLSELLEGVPYREVDDQKMLEALGRWEIKYRGLNGPLYGGIQSLLDLGYRPVLAHYENRFCTLYFVSPAALPGHIARMKVLGFTGGWVKHSVPSYFPQGR